MNKKFSALIIGVMAMAYSPSAASAQSEHVTVEKVFSYHQRAQINFSAVDALFPAWENYLAAATEGSVIAQIEKAQKNPDSADSYEVASLNGAKPLSGALPLFGTFNSDSRDEISTSELLREFGKTDRRVRADLVSNTFKLDEQYKLPIGGSYTANYDLHDPTSPTAKNEQIGVYKIQASEEVSECDVALTCLPVTEKNIESQTTNITWLDKVDLRELRGLVNDGTSVFTVQGGEDLHLSPSNVDTCTQYEAYNYTITTYCYDKDGKYIAG